MSSEKKQTLAVQINQSDRDLIKQVSEIQRLSQSSFSRKILIDYCKSYLKEVSQ